MDAPPRLRIRKLKKIKISSLKQPKSSPIYGMMLDVARHFIPVAQIKELIFLLSELGYNTLHLHLSDDQSFPIETKALNYRVNVFNPTEFYSIPDQIEIAQWASKHKITIIPEIDIPSHSLALQELLGLKVKKTKQLGIITTNYLPINSLPRVLQIYDELIQRFDSPFLHMGGDEAYKYKPFDDLISQVYQWAKAKKLQLILWDDALKTTNPPTDILVHRWRSRRSWMTKPAKEKIDRYQYLMSWGYYLDHADDPFTVFRRYPLTFGVDKNRGFIACLWTELVDRNNLMDTIFPTLYLLWYRWKVIPKLKAVDLKMREYRLGKMMYQRMKKYKYPVRGGWKRRRWAQFDLKALASGTEVTDPRSTSSVTIETKLTRPHDLYPVYSRDLITYTYILESRLLGDTIDAINLNDIKNNFISDGYQAFNTDISIIWELTTGWKKFAKNLIKSANTSTSSEYDNGLIPLFRYLLTL